MFSLSNITRRAGHRGLLAALFGLVLLAPLAAEASCYNPASGYAYSSTGLTMVGKSVRIQPNQPVGSVLGSWSSVTTASTQQQNPTGVIAGVVECSNGGGTFGWMGNLQPDANGVYASGIPGIGLRFKLTGTLIDIQRGNQRIAVSLETGGSRLALADGKYRADNSLWTFTYTLVKTGPIAINMKAPYSTFDFSSAPNAPASQVWVGGDLDTVMSGAAGRYVPFNIGSFYEWTIVPATCYVTTPEMTVPLTQAMLRQFKDGESNIGLTPFQVGLTCPTGVDSRNTISMVLSDNVNLYNSGNTLALTPDSTASGVGIQVLYSGTPVTFNTDPSNTTGKTPSEAMVVGTVGGTSYNIPMAARYIATNGAANVKVGTVNARMTITVYYD